MLCPDVCPMGKHPKVWPYCAKKSRKNDDKPEDLGVQNCQTKHDLKLCCRGNLSQNGNDEVRSLVGKSVSPSRSETAVEPTFLVPMMPDTTLPTKRDEFTLSGKSLSNRGRTSSQLPWAPNFKLQVSHSGKPKILQIWSIVGFTGSVQKCGYPKKGNNVNN